MWGAGENMDKNYKVKAEVSGSEERDVHAIVDTVKKYYGEDIGIKIFLQNRTIVIFVDEEESNIFVKYFFKSQYENVVSDVVSVHNGKAVIPDKRVLGYCICKLTEYSRFFAAKILPQEVDGFKIILKKVPVVFSVVKIVE